MPDEDFIELAAVLLWWAAFALGICLIGVMIGKALYG